MPVAVAADKRFRRAQGRPARRHRSWFMQLVRVVQHLVTAACFFGGVYLAGQQVAHATALHVNRIVVRGNARLTAAEVARLLAPLRGTHVLRVDLEWCRERVLKSPWVEFAAVRRVLPSTIEVFVRERQPVAIGHINDSYYLVDGTGTIIDEYSRKYDRYDLPIVDGLQSGRPGEPLVDDGRAALAARAISALRRDDGLYRRVNTFVLAGPGEVDVLLHDDPVLVRLGDDQFVERLQTYLDIAPRLREQVAAIDSVDLRLDGRVYVRPARAARVAAR